MSHASLVSGPESDGGSGYSLIPRKAKIESRLRKRGWETGSGSGGRTRCGISCRARLSLVVADSLAAKPDSSFASECIAGPDTLIMTPNQTCTEPSILTNVEFQECYCGGRSEGWIGPGDLHSGVRTIENFKGSDQH